MDTQEYVLMKGNEAIAHAAVRCGCDGYFGYPITPQSEVLETLALLKPWETTGMVVMQAESELAAINMLYGGGGSGKRVMTSSSSPGVALMQEGISYMAACEIPALIVNVQRGGPGLGTIQPGQCDYKQATVGGGNGDYQVIVLAPNSVQEMADFVDEAFRLAFKYRMPAMILSDGVIGQMMERVKLPEMKPRRSEQDIFAECPWATNGINLKKRKNNTLSSLESDPIIMDERNKQMQLKYKRITETETRAEAIMCDDAEYLLVGFGCMSRMAEEAMHILRNEGYKVGLFRPITLWPFPEKELREAAKNTERILVCELNAGQMLRDVEVAVKFNIPCYHYGRMGGVVPDPSEIIDAFHNL
ncbi:MAG: 3-methyl-2-oxobutanoate dehydrogenase subunit VorB [Prevotellaceae bacterium]|nr:3-methyl-2-oxobutanoate dehydrogenase subunit VorB [Prevotellaceae bacterium]